MDIIKQVFSAIIGMMSKTFNLGGFDISFLAVFLGVCVLSIIFGLIARLLS